MCPFSGGTVLSKSRNAWLYRIVLWSGMICSSLLLKQFEQFCSSLTVGKAHVQYLHRQSIRLFCINYTCMLNFHGNVSK